MKAAVVKEKGALEIWDVPVPELGPYDVLCRMCYGSTCAGTDNRLMDGKHPFPVTFPTILGHESVGRVERVGTKVKNFHIGDLITRVGCPALQGIGANWGGFAEYGIARDHWEMQKDGIDRTKWERNRVNQIVNPQIEEKIAPMIITWRETLSYIKRLGVQESSHLLLVGSGANALAFAVHATNLGAAVVVVGSVKKEETFRKLPICSYFDYKSEGLNEQIQELCQKEHWPGFDFLLDGVGGADIVNALIPLLKSEGVLGVYGWNDRDCYSINPFQAAGSFRVYAGGYDEEETNGEVQAMILRGQLDANLWYNIANPVPLDEIATAYQNLRQQKAFKYLIKL